MNQERWDDIVGRIKDSFDVLEHETEDLDPDPGTVERIVFITPAGQMKLERMRKPRVLETRGLGSNRIGSSTAVQTRYSQDEFIDMMTAFVWNEESQEWREVSPDRVMGAG